MIVSNILLWVERSTRIASTWNSMKKNDFFYSQKFQAHQKEKKSTKNGRRKPQNACVFFLLKITGSFFFFFDRIRFDSIDFVRVSSGVHYERDMQNAWLLSGCALTWICLNSTHACMEDCIKSTQLQLCKTLSVCACAHGSLTLSLFLLLLFFIVVYFWILYFLARTHLSSWNMLTLARDNFHQRVTYSIPFYMSASNSFIYTSYASNFEQYIKWNSIDLPSKAIVERTSTGCIENKEKISSIFSLPFIAHVSHYYWLWRIHRNFFVDAKNNLWYVLPFHMECFSFQKNKPKKFKQTHAESLTTNTKSGWKKVLS